MEKPGVSVQMKVELVIATPRSDTETLLQPHGRYRGMHLAEVFLVPVQYLVIRNMVSQKRVNAAAAKTAVKYVLVKQAKFAIYMVTVTG